MDQIRRVNDRWNELLAKTGNSDIERLHQEQDRRNLAKDGRRLCAVLRPHFVGEGELRRHQHVVDVVSKAMIRARDHVVADREREAEHLGRFYDWIGEITHLEPRSADHGAITRLDAFLTKDGMHFIEMNADCPGGAGHNDGIASVFQTLETFHAMAQEFDLKPLLLQPAVGRAIMGAWRDWGGTHPPSIALVGWFKEFGTDAETVAHEAQIMRTLGVGDIVATEPDGLEFNGRRLIANGVEVDLVYRLLLTREALEKRDEIKPLLSALRENAICMINPFHAELMGHKALFALLTDPDIDLGLTHAERKVIQDHVPWGRMLRETTTLDPTGHRVDLVDYALKNQENLVLKPTHEAKGDGVELGWRHNASSWEAAIREALNSDHIVQQRIPAGQVVYPVAEPGVPHRPMYEDMDPLIARGHLAGFLTRISETEIVNVSKQGSVVPSFVFRQ